MSLALNALEPTTLALLSTILTLAVTAMAIAICRAYGITLSAVGAAAGAGLISLSSLCLAQTLWSALLGAILGCGLLGLAVIDARLHRLPDPITLPLIAVGLTAAWIEHATLPSSQVAGVLVGYASLALIDWLYRMCRGRDGLGMGDAKLLAVAGAWLGWKALPAVVLVSCASGAVFLVISALRGRRFTALSSLPFGPFLAIGFWLCFVGQRVLERQIHWPAR